ncbi:response regulator [Kordia sp.]|uniref:response regulator n=1 Tax=Kordia sp. TaxID=1965332 RepID=UPI003B5A95B9
MIKVLIVDDHYLFAEGVASLFKPEDGIKVVAHTQNGNSAPSILEEIEIDVILMDIDMPVIDGIETMHLLKQKGFDIPILMLTMHLSIQKIRDALKSGAQGYIIKDASKPELIEAIKATSQRKNYFHSKINDQVFNYFRGQNRVNTIVEELSSREKEVVKCLAEGMNSNAIAEALFISRHTVKTHRRNIMHKLNVKTSAELIKLAIEKKIIDL